MLSLIDTLIILLYLLFVFILGLAFYRSKDNNDANNFLLGGRQLTLPAFVATLVSTWYGGILGVGEFSYLYGISNWIVFGVPYYTAALLFAFILAKKVQTSQLLTIPQLLEKTYDKPVSLMGALFVFIFTAPAAYVLMLGVLLQFFFNWPLWLGIVIGASFSFIYVFAGGFRSVVKTDYLQFSLMFAGFILLLSFCFRNYGGFYFLKTNLPSTHFLWHGGQGAMYIIMWFFIALSTLVEPAFYQRCFAARHPSVVKKGIIISVIFWIFFDFLTTMTGLYAKAILPNLSNPVTSYLDLAVNVLPPVLTGLFFAGLLATIMSTVDSYSLLAAMTIGRDYLWRLSGKQENSIQYYTRIGLVISTLFSIGLAIYGQSVIELWKQLGSITTPALLIPVVSSFFPKYKMSTLGAKLCIMSGAFFSLGWTILNPIYGQTIPLFAIEPIFPGLVSTLIIYTVDRNFYKSFTQA